jgi:hypothetical protein
MVTALFADTKDSTELMRDLDPEEARAIIDPALKLMIDAVRPYDGCVVLYRRRSGFDGICLLSAGPILAEVSGCLAVTPWGFLNLRDMSVT